VISSLDTLTVAIGEKIEAFPSSITVEVSSDIVISALPPTKSAVANVRSPSAWSAATILATGITQTVWMMLSLQ